MAMPTTRTPGFADANFCTAGISSLQGPHQDAHRFTTVGRAPGRPTVSTPGPGRPGTLTAVALPRSASGMTSGAAPPTSEDPQADRAMADRTIVTAAAI